MATTRTRMAENSPTTIMKIATAINNTIAELSASGITELMKRHLIQLRLIDNSGNWMAKELGKKDDFLLPKDLKKDKIIDFIDQIVRCIETNEYFKDFLEKAKDENFDHLFYKVQCEGKQVFPSVVTYAIVLERLTKAMRLDWKIIESCRDVWKKTRVKEGVTKYWTLFEKTKVPSVETGINLALKYHKSGKVPPTFGRVLLPVNIVEAILEDIRLGYKDNARSAIPLALNLPGAKKFNLKTGAGPSRWSEDKKAIILSLPLHEKWTSLYITWNLAFMSHYMDFPWLMTKLLIPQVNNYQGSPGEYLYNRGLALYTQIHYTSFGRVDFVNQGKETISWNDKELTKFWGKVNKENAKEYLEEVKNHDPSLFNRFKSKFLI